MKRVVRSAIHLWLLALAGAVLVSAQPTPFFPNPETRYFQYIFTSMGDPGRSPDELERRRQSYIGRMGLDARETEALLDALSQFSDSLRAFRLQADSVVASTAPGEPLDSNRDFAIDTLRSTHEESIKRLGGSLLLKVRATTANKMRAAMHGDSYGPKER